MRYDDPDLKINWPNLDNLIISEKDAKAMFLADYKKII